MNGRRDAVEPHLPDAAELARDGMVAMKAAAKALEFEKAALLRDQIVEPRRSME
jgi:hypothetical protein